MVEDGAFSHKIDYVTIFLEILNLEGHQNHVTGSRVTAILLNGWILPIGGFCLLLDFAYWWSFSGGGSGINGA